MNAKPAAATERTNFVCAVEASALLNCVASKDYDKDKCAALVEKLRACIKKHVSPSGDLSGIHFMSKPAGAQPVHKSA